jgi:uncharacterized protein YfaP (DUF2135 family)
MATTKDTAPPVTRELRGLALYREHADEITHEGHGIYTVPGCSGGTYRVDLAVFGGTESCSCPDRATVCKHVICATIYRATARAAARRAQAERTAARASRGNVAALAAAL